MRWQEQAGMDFTYIKEAVGGYGYRDGTDEGERAWEGGRWWIAESNRVGIWECICQEYCSDNYNIRNVA